MRWTAWSTLAVLGVYFWTIFMVGRARGRFGIQAPSMEGPPAFLSVLRVQANTVEQLVMLLPALWMCAYFLSDALAAAGGMLWCLGRVLYALAYYRDPAKRAPGFLIALAATLALLGGTAWGLLQG